MDSVHFRSDAALALETDIIDSVVRRHHEMGVAVVAGGVGRHPDRVTVCHTARLTVPVCIDIAVAAVNELIRCIASTMTFLDDLVDPDLSTIAERSLGYSLLSKGRLGS